MRLIIANERYSRNNCRKVRETAGLELTEVQQIYWRAVQRRMILSRVETLIDDNLERINEEGIKFPYELKVSLVKGEKGRMNS